MKAKYILILVFFTCFYISCLPESLGDKEEICFPKSARYSVREGAGTLVGLKAMRVIVVCWAGSEEEKYGLDEKFKQSLQVKVESQLKQNGIKVLSEEETRGKPRQPTLTVSINPTIIDSCGKAALYTILELEQFFFLPRFTDAGCFAVTWSDDRSRVCQADKLMNNIKSLTYEHINDFCEAYYDANPEVKK